MGAVFEEGTLNSTLSQRWSDTEVSSDYRHSGRRVCMQLLLNADLTLFTKGARLPK